MKRMVSIGVMLVSLMACWGPVRADVIISTFDSFNLGFDYGSWTPGNVVSGPSSLTIQSTGFGGGGSFINSLNASGESTVELTLTVNADTTPVVLVVLEDGDGTQYNYRWFSVPSGNQVLTMPLFPVPDSDPGISDSFVGNPGTTTGLDLSNLDFFNIQIDDSDAYDVSFENLAIVPEPATFFLLLGGVILTLSRRFKLGT